MFKRYVLVAVLLQILLTLELAPPELIGRWRFASSSTPTFRATLVVGSHGLVEFRTSDGYGEAWLQDDGVASGSWNGRHLQIELEALRDGRLSLALSLDAHPGQHGFGLRALEFSCELGERVAAFQDVPGCVPEQSRCWRSATVADGPYRGDAHLTALWDRPLPGGVAASRLHAAFLRRPDGSRCLPASAVASTHVCVGRHRGSGGSCFNHRDVAEDLPGAIIWQPKSTVKVTCSEYPDACFGDDAHLRQVCAHTCAEAEWLQRPASQIRCYSNMRMRPLLHEFARWRWFSQGRQDSILHLLLLHPDGVPLASQAMDGRFFVEFGSSGVLDSNTEYLRRLGWQGRLFDTRHSDARMELHQETITPSNVVQVFERHAVPHGLDLVSIDIDSCDVWVFLALTAPESPYRPRVAMIEFNRHFAADEDLAVACRADGWLPTSTLDGPIFGASLAALVVAAKARGYSLVWVEPCFDAFFVRDDLICASETLLGIEAFPNATAELGRVRCKDGLEWFAQADFREAAGPWSISVKSYLSSAS